MLQTAKECRVHILGGKVSEGHIDKVEMEGLGMRFCETTSPLSNNPISIIELTMKLTFKSEVSAAIAWSRALQ